MPNGPSEHEDPQDAEMISMVEGFTAAARLQPQDALRHARATLAHGLLDQAQHLISLPDSGGPRWRS